MQFNPIGWFEIPTKDIKRARGFYEKVLGHKLEMHEMGSMQMAWFPMVDEVYGSGGTLVHHKDYKPSTDGVVLYFTVPNVEKTIEKVKAEGGQVLVEKTTIGEHGFIAHIKDTEGNRIGIHSMKG